MNYRAISKLLGFLLLALSALMAPSLLFALWYRDGTAGPFLMAMVTTALAGGAFALFGFSRREDLFHREATAVAGLGWVLCAAAGALPFWFAGTFDSFADCFFESMSGFTTTGASVLTDIESLPEGVLFWRSFTHWLGGMGIIVLFVALLPFLGVGGRALFKSETPGPVKESLTPRVTETAKILWKIYLILTLAETLILMTQGLNLHSALCHSFGTLATGGYSTRNASIAAFDSTFVHLVIVFFMLAAATNFSLYYRVWKGERRAIWRDTEWRVFIGIVLGATLFVGLALRLSGTYTNLFLSLRDALFQVVSIQTTTGYATADFDRWPAAVKVLLVALMFVGGSAGSTGGGMKIIRCVILARVGWAMLEKVYSPRTVRKVRIGHATLSESLQRATLVFFLVWLFLFAAGSLAVATFEMGRPEVDIITSTTAVAATLNNIGPGLGLVGATQNYAFFSAPTKLLLSFFMVLGRLELYTILVLLAPRFWQAR